MLKILLALKNVPDDIMARLAGHTVEVMPCGNSVFGRVTQGNYHLVLVESAPDIVSSIKAADPRAEVVLFVNHNGEEVQAVKSGAFAVLAVPVDVKRFERIIEEIDDTFTMRREAAELENQLDQKYTFGGIVGRNPKILDIISFIKRVAPYFKIITITGDTGTGKEVVARALHALACKKDEPFVTSNCAGYVETLIESELFGHKKGSFTGAVNDKIGLFEAAKEGTLFLDEIGDLPLSFQPHLLRVLQNGEFRPVGSHRTLRSKCRIIAATGRNLKEEVRKGRFREDLFYRITPLIIHLPPLRERKDDILLLSRFMLKRYSEETGKMIRGISMPAQDLLLSHDWPGNIRELEHVISRAVILTEESFIGPSHLPPNLMAAIETEESERGTLDEVVRNYIEKVLDECQGNRSRAARRLGISRRALLRKIEKYLLMAEMGD